MEEHIKWTAKITLKAINKWLIRCFCEATLRATDIGTGTCINVCYTCIMFWIESPCMCGAWFGFLSHLPSHLYFASLSIVKTWIAVNEGTRYSQSFPDKRELSKCFCPRPKMMLLYHKYNVSALIESISKLMWWACELCVHKDTIPPHPTQLTATKFFGIHNI